MTNIWKCLLIVAASLGLLVSSLASRRGVQEERDRNRPLPLRAEPGYKVVFEDNFDTLDVSPDGLGLHTWYNGVWFKHKRAPLSNMSVSSSVLTLEWRQGQDSPETTITTLSPDASHFKAWRYGYFEARMKWDVVNGAWPAFWLIPVQSAQDEHLDQGLKEEGELDIFEGQGDHPHTFYGTIHDWVNRRSTSNKDNAFRLPSDTEFSQFHLYGLLWVPGRVTWFFDGKPLHEENTPAIFDKQDFFIVLGMQEGAKWKYGDRFGVTSPQMRLNVDWVRVWQK